MSHAEIAVRPIPDVILPQDFAAAGCKRKRAIWLSPLHAACWFELYTKYIFKKFRVAFRKLLSFRPFGRLEPLCQSNIIIYYYLYVVFVVHSLRKINNFKCTPAPYGPMNDIDVCSDRWQLFRNANRWRLPIKSFHIFCSTRCIMSSWAPVAATARPNRYWIIAHFPSRKGKATDAAVAMQVNSSWGLPFNINSFTFNARQTVPPGILIYFFFFSPSTQHPLLDDWLHNNYLWIAKRMSALKNDGELVIKVIITIKRWMMWWLTDRSIFFAAVFRTISLQLLRGYRSVKVLLNHIMIECLTTNTWESREHECTVYSIQSMLNARYSWY